VFRPAIVTDRSCLGVGGGSRVAPVRFTRRRFPPASIHRNATKNAEGTRPFVYTRWPAITSAKDGSARSSTRSDAVARAISRSLRRNEFSKRSTTNSINFRFEFTYGDNKVLAIEMFEIKEIPLLNEYICVHGYHIFKVSFYRVFVVSFKLIITPYIIHF